MNMTSWVFFVFCVFFLLPYLVHVVLGKHCLLEKTVPVNMAILNHKQTNKQTKKS